MLHTQEIETIKDHIVILGWSARVERIIRELRNEVHRISDDIRPILVVTPSPAHPAGDLFENVYFLHGNLNDVNTFKRAYMDRAHMILIPCQTESASDKSDALSIFTLLCLLSASPDSKVCIEFASADNGRTLELIRDRNLTSKNVEVVSFESVSERLLAQCAVNTGVIEVYNELLSFSPDSNELYVAALPRHWVGKSFRELALHCFEREVIVIGYRGEKLVLNPKNRDYVLEQGDLIWYLSFNKGAGVSALAAQP